jgi:hypothetical protein
VAWWLERRRQQKAAPDGSWLWLGFWGGGRGARGRPGGSARGLVQWNTAGAELSSGAAMALRALCSARTAVARVANCSRVAAAAVQQQQLELRLCHGDIRGGQWRREWREASEE